jgi:hypothetical protein
VGAAPPPDLGSTRVAKAFKQMRQTRCSVVFIGRQIAGDRVDLPRRPR